MLLEFSEYIESRIEADPLDGTEIWVLSQDGGARRLTTQDLADFIIAIGIPSSASQYRDPYDASVNAYPSSGGSGGSGAIVRGDIFPVSVAGELDVTGLGVITVNPDALLIAKVNNPTNSAADWIVKQ